MLSTMLFYECATSSSAILLFLLGIGESFHNAKTKSIGIKNSSSRAYRRFCLTVRVLFLALTIR
jgi:hypothetical protein